MTLESINYVALFAGTLLLMTRCGYRPHLWRYGKIEAQSESEEGRSVTVHSDRLGSPHPHGVPIVGATAPRGAASGALEDKADHFRSQLCRKSLRAWAPRRLETAKPRASYNRATHN